MLLFPLQHNHANPGFHTISRVIDKWTSLIWVKSTRTWNTHSFRSKCLFRDCINLFLEFIRFQVPCVLIQYTKHKYLYRLHVKQELVWICPGIRVKLMKHCATSRKVAGSIPDCVTGIFHRHNPSGRTMALGSTQPLKEMSTRNIYWG
jgi:hypothetical protein